MKPFGKTIHIIKLTPWFNIYFFAEQILFLEQNILGYKVIFQLTWCLVYSPARITSLLSDSFHY
ncbi:hypothetical protein, partial [Bacillus paralicheniformis]|uniref:hypothetical protein n=1 Tax=Bacillus paralicheniformis TaxID=1648923 RepID=UPI0020BED050